MQYVSLSGLCDMLCIPGTKDTDSYTIQVLNPNLPFAASKGSCIGLPYPGDPSSPMSLLTLLVLRFCCPCAIPLIRFCY